MINEDDREYFSRLKAASEYQSTDTVTSLPETKELRQEYIDRFDRLKDAKLLTYSIAQNKADIHFLVDVFNPSDEDLNYLAQISEEATDGIYQTTIDSDLDYFRLRRLQNSNKIKFDENDGKATIQIL